MRSPAKRALVRAILGLFHAGGRLLPAETRMGRHARRLLVRFAPAPEPPPDEEELDLRAALAQPDPHRLRIAVKQLLQDPAGRLTFPDAPSPAVSVLLVTRDKVHAAYRCLESLLAHGGTDYEVIVADDASRDRTADLVSRLRYATCIRHHAEVGAARARNGAAGQARGRYLLLLDQNIALGPGSLTALVAAAEADESCGAVGGRLVLPDGRLLEAGGVVWRDGDTDAYGAGADALAPEASYARQVDFCSVAFLLVRRPLFERLGGLDETFAPGGPHESADLCMGIRRLGHKVLFAPGAIAFSSDALVGNASDDGTRAADRTAFVRKWRAELEGQPDAATTSLIAARDRAAGPRILVVEDRIPAPSRGAGYPRSYAMLEMLPSLGYTVTLFPYHDRKAHQPWVHCLQREGIEVMAGKTAFPDFAAERSAHYDAIIVTRPPNFREIAPLLGRLFPRATVVYDAEALWFVREKLKADVEGVPWTDEASEEAELALLRAADLVVTVSEHEKGVAIAAVPGLDGRVHVWGHPVQARPTVKGFGDRKDLLFVGGFQLSPSPNEDAVAYFVREVLPRIRERLECSLQVVGFGAPDVLARFESTDVRLTGCVDDLTGWYDSGRVFVVPHRYGAGIPLKLCEAMARGVPAVVSELMAAQLGVEDGREVLVGRTPAEFAERVVELYRDERLWTRLRDSGLVFVRRHNDPASLRSELDTIVRTALCAARRRG